MAITGPDGAVVKGLTAADFELRVDGAITPIQQFRFVDSSLAPPEADTPDGVASNVAEPGGVFALVIDELNLSTRSGMQARRLAVDFIQKTLQSHDYAAVLRSGATSALLFSNDRDRLAAIARGTSGRGGSAQGPTELCAGVHLEQAGAEPSSATHRFVGRTAVRAHATISAPDAFKGTVVTAVLSRGEASPVTAPASVSPAGRGWWRIESDVTLPAAVGRYRLTLQSDRDRIEGCSTELDVIP